MRLISSEEMALVAGGSEVYYSDIIDAAYSEYYSPADITASGYSSYDPAADYCTGVPDAPFGYNFAPACYNHDENYSSDTSMTRADADSQFLSDMREICTEQYNNDLLCRATADVYYGGVRAAGGFFYEGPVETAFDSPTYYNP